MTTSRPIGNNDLLLPKIWLLYTALCTLTGWTLSAFHALTATGWIVAALALGIPGWCWLRPSGRLDGRRVWACLRRRLRRPLPLLFAVLVALSIGRGLANPEMQGGDVISYRVPRMLDWIFAHGWHWIGGLDARFDIRGTGAEWMAMPFLLLGRTEHFAFVVTLVSFAMLPSLLFVAYREMGAAPRVAWTWAWIAPTACCYLLQAGTLSTDGMGAFYSVAAVAFALRARRRASFALLGYSILAAGLMTNQKASNLPLLLPILAAWAANWPLLRRHPGRLAGCCALATAVSFFPIGVSNFAHGSGFLGLQAERFIPPPPSPAVALALNSVYVSAYAVLPPVVSPGHDLPNLLALIQSAALRDYVRAHFEPHYGDLPRVMSEEYCGLGLGVTVLLIATWCFHGRQRRRAGIGPARVVRWCVWIALWVVCAKATLFAIPRVLAPYYLLLLPSLLVGGSAERAVRSPVWRRLAVLQSLGCAVLLLTLTSSPPWPLMPAVRAAQRWFPQNSIARLFVNVYGTGPQSLAFWGNVGAQLPPEEKIFGIVRRWDAPELGLWKPIGSHRIVHVLPQDDHDLLQARGIRHVLVYRYSDETLEEVEQRLGAELERDFVFTHPHHAGHVVHLLKLR